MITVVTPTVPDRADLLAECAASVRAAGLPHLIELDTAKAGPAAVRNRLVAQVRTPWVLFLDDDDLLYPQYPALIAPHLRHADVVYTAWELTGSHDEPKPKPGPFDGELLMRQNYIPVTACVRTKAFRAVGGFDERAHLEDHELWKALYAAGNRFLYIPVIAWTYRRRPGSRTETTGG